ncbi:unnamed protein product [Acanthoscelides obtectus]|uniref:Malate dehydrogenase, mitochondrial n=1 Tax=Acanthoscelides obtectus TaxID=200917 RepID=A0A9P0Q011_ACAOB|nr:unnamed protein product [Acanthoscelides obtectus]CAK1622014.1 Malate dehydrogenase, mitochondrial [Acanthoscelides obtectus]
MWIKMIFNITPVFQKHLNEYVSNFFENGLLDKIIGCKRNYSLSSGNVKVTVVGAAGKMGKPLCLMLKQSLMIDELSMHDVKTTGDALELNNIDTSCKVTAYSGKSNLPPALKGSNVVVVIAAGPDSDSLTPDKQWEQNSKIVSEIMSVHAKYSPKGKRTGKSMMCEVFLKDTQTYRSSERINILTVTNWKCRADPIHKETED